MGTIVKRTGRVHLAPIEGSVDDAVIPVDLDLTRADGVLILGDLRLAAQQCSDEGRFEAAHRLWTVVREAARRAGDNPLITTAIAKAEVALAQVGSDESSQRDQRRRASDARKVDRRKGVSYDYFALAHDRADGMTQSGVAEKWDCSPGTVARAVSYVQQRADAIDARPELLIDIHRGDAVAVLADRYQVPTKVMRWIVSDYWDRRT